MGCNGSGVTSVFRKSGERRAGGGVSGGGLVADRGGVSGVMGEGFVNGPRVVICGWSMVGVVGDGRGSWLVSTSFRRECWRLIFRRVLGVCGRLGGWKERGEGSRDGTGSGDMPFSECGWELVGRHVASEVRRRPRYCSARVSAERMSASTSMSCFVSR